MSEDDDWIYIPMPDRQVWQDKKNRLMAEALDLIQASASIHPIDTPKALRSPPSGE